MPVVIKKMSPELVDDYFLFFDKIAFANHPEWGCECYCCFFHAESQEAWKAVTAAENKAAAREMILDSRLTGQMAYVDDVPAAWCHYDLKLNLQGLPVFYPETLGPDGDDAGVASVVCFTVAQGYRGKGLAKVLLTAACEDLATRGVSIVEAYPSKVADNDEHHYHGPLSLYLAQGFSVYRDLPEMTVVRKLLVSEPV